MSTNKIIIFVIYNFLIFSMASFAIWSSVKTNKASEKTTLVTPINEKLNRDASLSALPTKEGDTIPSLAPILKNLTPAIVNISTKGTVKVQNNPFFQDPFFQRFFRHNNPNYMAEQETQSIGSGVIVDGKNGYILTNNHVVKNADTIYVTLLNNTRLEAKLIGTDVETDIAVLQVDKADLAEVKLGNSGNLEVGDFVIAIGNPFGLGHTVTSGIVSALGRSGLGIDGYENFIQTDASINPGNSGGALINLKGELIGINTAILSKSGGNVGIGFAIPTNMARSVMNQLIEHGKVERGRIGVQIQDLTPEITEVMNIDITEGALVVNVAEESPAEKAGIKPGDIILLVNGNKVSNSSDLRNAIGTLRVGDEVKIRLLREGEFISVSVKIGKIGEISSNNGVKSSKLALVKGVTFKANKNGVVVVEIAHNSPAYRAGLKKGDIIFAVNKIKISTPEELFKIAEKNKKGLLINLLRGNAIMFLVIH